jgi:hypothetical protein
MNKVSDGARTLGRTAQGVRHGLKDRMLERRLDHMHEETERLEAENSMLRDQLEESHEEHQRILDVIDERLKRSKGKGGRLFFLVLLGAGAFAWMKMRNPEMIDRWLGGSTGQTQMDMTTG